MMSPPGQKAFSMLNWERVEGTKTGPEGKKWLGQMRNDGQF